MSSLTDIQFSEDEALEEDEDEDDTSFEERAIPERVAVGHPVEASEVFEVRSLR
jgi:hypothetical protein